MWTYERLRDLSVKAPQTTGRIQAARIAEMPGSRVSQLSANCARKSGAVHPERVGACFNSETPAADGGWTLEPLGSRSGGGAWM